MCIKCSKQEFHNTLSEKGRVELHAHTDISNIRLIDSINSVDSLLEAAAEMNLSGLAITDHESVSNHVKAIQKVREMKKEGKLDESFKLILGNEIYLVDSLEEVRDNYRSGITKFPHYLLIAKNERGHEALRILSSKAWESSFYTGKLERVPTLKSNLEEIIKQFPDSLIATSACLGSESSILILEADRCRQEGDKQGENIALGKLMKFLKWNIELYGKEDFYLELQPSDSYEQMTVNKVLVRLAEMLQLQLVITSDAHYLRPNEREIHEAFLKSKESERETASFYENTYLHTVEEMINKLHYLDKEVVYKAIINTIKVSQKVEDYTIEGETIIPQSKLPQFEVRHLFDAYYKQFQSIQKLAHSSNDQDRYLVYLIENGFEEHFLSKPIAKEKLLEVVARIDIELEQIYEISEQLNQSMSAYYVTVAKIVDLMWGDECGDRSKEEGSLVGAGRGSAVAFLINYLIGVTQVNPLAYGVEVPYWRHLHKSRADISALDIDLDITSTKKHYIFSRMREYFGENQVIQVCTFGTEKSKSAIQTACRGLGIDSDIAQYLSSYIPFERGELWSLKDCVEGNEEKGREPIAAFVNELKSYPNLIETAMRIEGLINKRSIHAGGVLVLNEHYTKRNAMMRAPNGSYITQYNLDDSQACGGIKFDVLSIEANDKIQATVELLLRYKQIEWQGTLRKTFNKYFHPEIIDKENPELYEMVGADKVVDLFQFSTQLGQSVVKKAKPKNLLELISLNSLMRLMSEGEEQPIDTFILYKNDISLWYEEMKSYNLTQEEIKIFEKYLAALNGVADTQEAVMLMAMDKDIAGFTVKEANYLRKGIAKRKKEVQEEVKAKLFEWGKEKGTRVEVIEYLWLQITRMLG